MIEWYFVLLFIYVDCTCYKYCLKPSSLGPTDTGLFWLIQSLWSFWLIQWSFLLIRWSSWQGNWSVYSRTWAERSCFSQKWSCYSQWNVCVDKHILKKISVKQQWSRNKTYLDLREVIIERYDATWNISWSKGGNYWTLWCYVERILV